MVVNCIGIVQCTIAHQLWDSPMGVLSFHIIIRRRKITWVGSGGVGGEVYSQSLLLQGELLLLQSEKNASALVSWCIKNLLCSSAIFNLSTSSCFSILACFSSSNLVFSINNKIWAMNHVKIQILSTRWSNSRSASSDDLELDELFGNSLVFRFYSLLELLVSDGEVWFSKSYLFVEALSYLKVFKI